MCKLTSMSKVNDFLDDMLAEGWHVIREHKHVVLGSPDNLVTLTIPKSARDGSSTPRNSLALLKRKRREYHAHAGGCNSGRI